jgi:RNA polymerase sporulation-specific sigma factor
MRAIKSRANRYAGVIGQDNEDFIQEGLLALFRAVKGYDEASGFKFSTYAITCVNNAMASAIRKHMKSLDADRLGASGDEAALKPPEELFIEQEGSAQLAWQIRSLLSDFERQTLKLYLRGNSYLEISSALSSTTKAVDNALQRVRKKLRPTL